MIERIDIFPTINAKTCMPRVAALPKDIGECYIFWCAGCDAHHQFVTKLAYGDGGPTWKFTGTLEKPTFDGSILHPGKTHPVTGEITRRCHLSLVDRMVHYMPDCSHGLAR